MNLIRLLIIVFCVFVIENTLADPIAFKKFDSIQPNKATKAWVTSISNGLDIKFNVVYLPDLTKVKIKGLMTLVESKKFKIRKSRIVVNAGYAAEDKLTPKGLLISNGIVKSTVLSTKYKTRLKTNVIKQYYSLPGIVCQSKETNSIDLLTVDDYSPGMCIDAVQTGPFIIEPDGEIGIYETERSKPEYKRTVICQDLNKNLNLIFTEPVHLFDLGQWLKKSVNEGGLGCNKALLLASDESAAMVYAGAKEKKSGKFGKVDGDQISALFIHTR